MTKSLPSLKFRRSQRDTIAPSEEVSHTCDSLLDDGITGDSDGALFYKELEVDKLEKCFQGPDVVTEVMNHI